ncbi:ATP-binding cassette domain-containing protein [Paenibacillus hexagrammi]|uniref:ATP-binding cassette domain-containing protein n=1 Tax=Paenibacillus hexagrammi TaxID=2908839 RepID=A0ABY3SN40_9BACL|nr:ATP-binding cassette domain-containing protein [Paenibacillus sp. YPD9-1]UJF34644.1 ATP-binding cassette domain-containing protein [Paenibacillus sp. YPD9-1]
MEAIRTTENEKNQTSTSSIVLSMQGISKSFSGVTVLNNVNIDLYRGEVHALMGENGAGKSTLMKIMAGIHRPDSGRMIYRERNTTWHNAMEARENGISVIHQELNLSPNITIGENVLMGTRFPRNKFGMVDWKQVYERARTLLQSIGSELDPRAYVSTLSVAQQQMVEIARALSIEAEVLVMDEPTASLTHKEIEKLFIIINELKQKRCRYRVHLPSDG